MPGMILTDVELRQSLGYDPLTHEPLRVGDTVCRCPSCLRLMKTESLGPGNVCPFDGTVISGTAHPVPAAATAPVYSLDSSASRQSSMVSYTILLLLSSLASGALMLIDPLANIASLGIIPAGITWLPAMILAFIAAAILRFVPVFQAAWLRGAAGRLIAAIPFIFPYVLEACVTAVCFVLALLFTVTYIAFCIFLALLAIGLILSLFGG